MVHNTDKLEEAGTSYNARPTDAPWCECGASKEAWTPLRRCHSRCVLGVGRRTSPQEWGTTGAAWEGPSCYKLINKTLEYSN